MIEEDKLKVKEKHYKNIRFTTEITWTENRKHFITFLLHNIVEKQSLQMQKEIKLRKQNLFKENCERKD